MNRSIVDEDTFQDILESVRKPASYLGTEPNSVHKDYKNIKASIALAFPDLYELGMSHLGLKILYNIINSERAFVAERVFAPAKDFADAMLAHKGLPLMSLETRRPLREFDLIGFTIPYELSYTTILKMLDLADIPVRAKERGDDYPLIIGGGASVYNPEPLAAFFDLFLLGDGERVTHEIMRIAGEMRGKPKGEILREMSKLDGAYVPSFFDVTYKEDGEIENITPLYEDYEKARRTWLPTLTESPYPVKMVVPFTETVQNRVNVEIDRGCTQGCRFCQAGTTYRPVRERTPDEVAAIMEEAVENTGYEDVSVMSLSAGDHSHIEPLLTTLMDRYAEDKVSLSLPSLRSATVTEKIIEQVGRVKKTGFTITAEAGTDRLRNVLNKKVTDEEIFAAAARLLEGGWRNLKLYFMIGLPTETDDDIDAISDLAIKLNRLNVDGKNFSNVSISVGNFVPKAHTAFQWFGQDTPEELQRKKDRIFMAIRRHKRLRLKYHSPYMSQLEALFSRGDRKLSDLVEAAFRKGAWLDGWSEHFSKANWDEAIKECCADVPFYAEREIGIEEKLPWDHIDCGLTKKFLTGEHRLAKESRPSVDCKVEKCLACGLDPKGCFTPYAIPSLPEIKKPEEKKVSEKQKYRLSFEKRGDARFFSHLETKTILHRAFRRAELSLAYSEGFSPQPKISFAPALPVGMESYEEFIDIQLLEERDVTAIIGSLNKFLPRGLSFTDGSKTVVKLKSIQESFTSTEYLIQFFKQHKKDELMKLVEAFKGKSEFEIVKEKKNKVKRFDLKPHIDTVAIDESGLKLNVVMTDKESGSARPSDLLFALFGENPPKNLVIKIRSFTR